MSDQGQNSGSGSRRTPLGGRVGAVIVSITPIVSLILFFVFGFLGGWNWSWLIFLLVPLAWLIVYGPGSREGNSR